MPRLFLFLLCLTMALPLAARRTEGVEWHRGRPLHLVCDTANLEPVVGTALDMFRDDCRRVLGSTVTLAPSGDIILRLDAHKMHGRWEAFCMDVCDGRLIITGSDSHGLAYGLLELSRMMGVSPWEWWADVTPRRREFFTLPGGFHTEQAPDVAFRGIFINDEDWGMLPWATQNHEPNATKTTSSSAAAIGPRTHERIFQLLLRLRANSFWPAMHACSHPFFLTEGNRQMALRYGIYIGTSHCEPMACNVNGEWNLRGQGEYDYVHNATSVQHFWEERVRDVASQPILYTLGMRGVHDGAMQGARTVDEQRTVLQRVINDQRNMLRRLVNPDLERVPQVFIPYKEVLDVYRRGLTVPDDVCLMWCDDNYGYLRHFPTPSERRRQGGHGVYYHVSYWGRPHDYLWLATFSPALLMQQMSQAYDHDMRRMWILNVGDLKPAEYQTQLFLDMAWDIRKVRRQGVRAHLSAFLQENLGLADSLASLLLTHYQLAHRCKPEFLGGTRVEEPNRQWWSTVRDLPFTREEIDHRRALYPHLEDEAERLAHTLPDDRRAAYFQLVKYPVQAAAEMNKKMLLAQRARHGHADWQESHRAHDSIQSLTRLYNTPKWRGIMDSQPRRLPVFQPVPEHREDSSLTLPLPLLTLQGTDARRGTYKPQEALGYEGGAVLLQKGKDIVFDLPPLPHDTLTVELRLLPTHAIKGDSLRLALRLDNTTLPPLNFETYGRSEEWKQAVLRNQSVRRITLPLRSTHKPHRLLLRPLDEGLILDQIVLY